MQSDINLGVTVRDGKLLPNDHDIDISAVIDNCDVDQAVSASEDRHACL